MIGGKLEMNRLFRNALLLSALTVLLGGCSVIAPLRPLAGGGTLPVLSDSTGEAWYVKNQYFLFFVTSSDIYYCDGKGTCRKASTP